MICAASAIALGTYSGGWRIIRTVGTRIIKMDTAQGFAAQGAGASVILASSHFGYPLSTTHVISGGIMGAGAAKRFSAVRWGVAGSIVAAWMLTLPAAGLFGALAWWLAHVFGTGALGPLLITLIAFGLLGALVAAPPRADLRAGGGRRVIPAVILTIVNTTTLGKAIAYSLAAGIGIAVIFGAGVTSAAGLLDARRDGRTLAELAWGALAIVCVLGAGAAIVLGIVVMTEK